MSRYLAGEGRAAGVRFATFNTALFRADAGQLADDLAAGGDKQAQTVAAIIQRLRPDVLLVNEFDYDETGRAIAAFQETLPGGGARRRGSDPLPISLLRPV